MMFTIERGALVRVLGPPARIANRASAQAAGGVLIDAVEGSIVLTATGPIGTVSTAVEATVKEGGKVLLPARVLYDLVRALDGDITFSTNGDRVSIKAGDFTGFMKTLPVGNFPEMGEPEGKSIIADISEGLSQVIPAASKDESRGALTGVRLATVGSTVTLAATDAVRAAEKTLPYLGSKVKFAQVFPAQALDEAGKVNAENIVLGDDGTATFVAPGFRFKATPMTGKYPDYRKFIPESLPNSLTLDRQELLKALGQVGLLNDDSSPVNLHYETQPLALEVSIKTPTGAAKALVKNLAGVIGKSLDRSFNLRFLHDGLEAIDGQYVTIEFGDEEQRPVVMRGVEESGAVINDYFYLLMPLRISTPAGAKNAG